MPLFHLVLVALIQGITEFLPVSSSGHLILLPALTGLDDQGLVIDVAAHVGTLLAVILFFRRDVGEGIAGLRDLASGRRDTYGARLALGIVVATIPVVLVGFVLSATGLEEHLRSTAVIGWTMLLFGLVLYWADTRFPEGRTARSWSLRHALVMGLWQVLALIPGTSRSGITITGARTLGFDRREAARLSMLMSIPVIAASGLLLGLDVARTADAGVARDGAIVAGLSFLSALAALALMMRLLRSVSYTPYVVYRVILGLILLGIAYL
ncbi:undecaprenyl-diphosphate phosphatase [Wenxinia saemankumensis]|uniref:Undecaprenyl-diphosphatase n=1 Tax=Wenxinia saemankumensis TaxID=1447782 RepID=A0A1M6FRY0_9RHOB|nr:undecaprenyl-diphosphate phosphatase [Wenxinia saemankumensis]SHJ00379.1 Undecaprenyl-diphosphatase [Wenxinia saemankumensis]